MSYDFNFIREKKFAEMLLCIIPNRHCIDV